MKSFKTGLKKTTFKKFESFSSDPKRRQAVREGVRRDGRFKEVPRSCRGRVSNPSYI